MLTAPWRFDTRNASHFVFFLIVAVSQSQTDYYKYAIYE